MPKVTVKVPHQGEPKETFGKIRGALEKTVKDFQGVDLQLTDGETSADFKFRSMAFTITGRAEATPSEVVVEIDLPFAALMFKEMAEKAITKNVTRSLAPPASDKPG
ncbi:MAG TPA: polyhydroxyalkanoic acid system family protein [Pirellulaceae bacterium]|nr:polyhydroxyalkanoic acid system family protein [Pirellulaceae bacterium]